MSIKGAAEPAKKARPAGTGKLEPCCDCLISGAEEKSGIAMPEQAADREAQHGIKAGPASLSSFLRMAEFARKRSP